MPSSGCVRELAFFIDVGLMALRSTSPPPGLQSKFERFSLVFFTRPANGIMLRALKEESKLISESVEKYKDAGLDFEPQSTAAEWYERRSQTRKTSNWKVSDNRATLSGKAS